MLPTVFVVHGDLHVIDAVSAACVNRSLHVRSYSNAEDLVKTEVRKIPGCLILDVILPGMGGLDLLDDLASRGILIPTIILTAHGNVAICASAFRRGVMDFIEIPFDAESLIKSIDVAVQSDVVFRKAIAQKETVTACLNSLTARQREVLSLLLSGHSMKTVANQLRVTQQTIARHRTGILRTFSVTSDVELVRKLIETGYFTKFNAVPESLRGDSWST